MFFSCRSLTAALALSVLVASGCSDNPTEPQAPNPPLGLTATAKTSTSIQVTFSGVAGDASYDLERAEGATGAFAAVTNIPAPAAGGLVTYVDASLKITTTYRYRVFANKGGLKSTSSSEVSVATLDVGNATAKLVTDITANRTLYADTVYTLEGVVHVANGATLTIEPGTKIVGDVDSVTALFILRGARIQAIGTAALPIVFTSSKPVGQRRPGDWGGLIIVGNAPDNRSGVVNVEGTGTFTGGVVGGKNYTVQYNGGSVATDNSGTLQYVRVEYAGFAPKINEEFNSFTFASVGSGTRISYLQASAGLDDSYEFFGGGFDIDHLVAFETGDDMFDMSEGFSGRMQYLIGYTYQPLPPLTGRGTPATDLEGIENDGCNGDGCDLGFDSAPFTIPLIANFTLIGPGDQAQSGASGGWGMVLRRGTGGYYVNGVVARFTRSGISMRDAATFTRAASAQIPDLATTDLAVRNVYFTETPTVFDAANLSMDVAGNNLTLGAALATTLFTALPATKAAPTGNASFDFSPIAGSAIATGGLATFTGKLQTKAGAFVVPTAYRGAVDPSGAKWWQGWTNFVVDRP